MNIVVDSSVLIDWINLADTPQVARLDAIRSIEENRIVIGDLMLVEILQGARDDLHAKRIERILHTMHVIDVAGARIASEAATNYRRLRALGVTPRKTIDTLIATRCIVDDLPLLFSDRDFQPFVDHLGLRDAMREPA